MIIRCRFCKREFDKPSHRNQHERDAHKNVKGVSAMSEQTLEALKRLADDAELFMKGGVCGLKPSIDNARAILSAANAEPVCPTCKGNDGEMPCAYPSNGMTGCLRDKRFAESVQAAQGVTDEPAAVDKHVTALKQIASGDIQCASLREWREKVMKMAAKAVRGSV